MPNSRPPSSGRQYSPAATSKTMGTRAGSRSGCGSVTAIWCRTPPAGMRIPDSAPTCASFGPPVSTTRPVAMGPALVSTPATRSPAMTSPVNRVCSRTWTPLVARATA